MIMQKTTVTHKDRNAKTVDEFNYRDMDSQLAGANGTGVRYLAGDFIRQGKALERFVMLKDDGCVLEIYMLFKSIEYLNEFHAHPISIRAKSIFAKKTWSITTEQYPVNDFLNIRTMLDQLPSVV